MNIKSVSPKFRQHQIAKELCCSSSTLQRYRQDVNMLSPHSIPPIRNKSNRKTSSDLRRPQTTSNDPVVNSMVETFAPVKPGKTKNKIKSGGNFEFNGNYSDEVFQKNL